jgi:hypothetical protein
VDRMSEYEKDLSLMKCHEYCRRGNLEGLRELFKDIGDDEARRVACVKGAHGNTALHWAASGTLSSKLAPDSLSRAC